MSAMRSICQRPRSPGRAGGCRCPCRSASPGRTPFRGAGSDRDRWPAGSMPPTTSTPSSSASRIRSTGAGTDQHAALRKGDELHVDHVRDTSRAARAWPRRAAMPNADLHVDVAAEMQRPARDAVLDERSGALGDRHVEIAGEQPLLVGDAVVARRTRGVRTPRRCPTASCRSARGSRPAPAAAADPGRRRGRGSCAGALPAGTIASIAARSTTTSTAAAPSGRTLRMTSVPS